MIPPEPSDLQAVVAANARRIATAQRRTLAMPEVLTLVDVERIAAVLEVSVAELVTAGESGADPV